MTRPDYCPIAQEPCQAMCVLTGVRCQIQPVKPATTEDLKVYQSIADNYKTGTTMNQNDQMMREALREFLVQEMPAGTVIGNPEWWVPKIMQALNHTPDTGKMVRLTDDSLISIYSTCKAEWKATNKRQRQRIALIFGNAIMDAMIAKNGGSHATD